MTTAKSSAFDRRTFLAATASAAIAAPAAAQTEPPATVGAMPETPSQGALTVMERDMSEGSFSKSRLARMHETMSHHVESGYVPGLVTLVARRGEVHVDAIGQQDVGGPAPMRRDTIFRIASLSKPVTAAAAMMLVEECRLRLDDPVDRWLPELADRKVLRSLESEVTDTVPAHRPITLRDLLTFRLGLGAVMVFPEKYPIKKAMSEAGVAPGPFLPTHEPDELMKRYGSLPLVHQPGERWLYDTGSHILGVLIARASGKSLGDVLRERIFEPLGMKDTGFSVPEEKLSRLATSYWTEGGTRKELVVFDEARGGRFASPPAFESGSGGLVSTVDDYYAFCRMMLDKGLYGRDRLLSRPSVELMTTDQITPEQKAASPFVPGFWDSRGWGFGLSVFTRRDALENVPGRFGWDGGYGTSGYSDPHEDLVGILMTQRVMDSPVGPPTHSDFWTSAYQAIDD
jgi:CubicO group peptidase (beta-lactamase class C family)